MKCRSCHKEVIPEDIPNTNLWRCPQCKNVFRKKK